MAKFADTPKWKKNRQWDADTQQWTPGDKLVTRKQRVLLWKLSNETGIAMPSARTRREAQSQIGQLLHRKTLHLAAGKR